jgi:hypothetical protein
MAESNKDQYEELVSLIGSVESGYQPADVAMLDLSDTFETDSNVYKPTYAQMISIIESMEGGGKPRFDMPEKQKQQKTAPVPPTPPIAPTVAVLPAHEKLPPKPSETHRMSAKMELGKITERLGEFEEEMKMRGINTTGLVLPSLSTADQITELERIIEGLQGHIFDKDHIETIEQEVYGLSKIVKLQKAKQARVKTKPPAQDAETAEMEGIRNQRLESALNLMKNYGVA